MTLSIDDYNTSAADITSVIALAVDFHTKSQHELAMLFVEQALQLGTTDEQRIALDDIAAISGYYSKLSSRVSAGKDACEFLATNNSLPWHHRNTARQNSVWYMTDAKTLFPSTQTWQIDIIPPDDYKPMNPSISFDGKNLYMIQRTVNYTIRSDGSYDMRGDTAIRTRNYFVKFNNDMTIASSEEILPPVDMPAPVYDLVCGFEDSRLFFLNGEPWCTSTVRELNSDGYCEIVIARLVDNNDGTWSLTDYKVIQPSFCDVSHQKNWMPMVTDNKVFFVYSTDPTRIIDTDGNLCSENTTPKALDSFRGGSPLVNINDKWLTIIHESHVGVDNRRTYAHRFVTYDFYGNVDSYSNSFFFTKKGIEFAAGMAIHPVTGKLLVSFGLDDRESHLASFDLNEVRENLIKCE